jgi:hypothetical protein
MQGKQCGCTLLTDILSSFQRKLKKMDKCMRKEEYYTEFLQNMRKPMYNKDAVA